MTSTVVDKDSSSFVFEQVMNEVIEDVFSSLGTGCKQTIYDRLEKEHGLKKGQVADHIVEFSEAIEHMFGCAALLLEIRMMKRLSRRVPQFKYRPKGMVTFADYVKALGLFIETC